ncbi:LPS translocon maturation chaperone LptM [Paraherbaspirillum soli]|uniref:Lipoprotein n=1 Tax=Paraherbaspirillum soli TaxID=631222 RepID=A0ABW0M4B5_9BURK
MKPTFDLPRVAMVTAMLALLTACGQKGPLFMPAKLPPPAVKTTPATPVKPDVPETPDAPATSPPATR